MKALMRKLETIDWKTRYSVKQRKSAMPVYETNQRITSGPVAKWPHSKAAKFCATPLKNLAGELSVSVPPNAV
jgi:hypothetical protein